MGLIKVIRYGYDWHGESVRASERIDVEENRGDDAEEVDFDDDKLEDS